MTVNQMIAIAPTRTTTGGPRDRFCRFFLMVAIVTVILSVSVRERSWFVARCSFFVARRLCCRTLATWEVSEGGVWKVTVTSFLSLSLSFSLSLCVCAYRSVVHRELSACAIFACTLAAEKILLRCITISFSAAECVNVLDLVQQEVSGKDYVFIKSNGADGPIAKKVYIQTGESYEGKIIIVDGLKGGEELIIEGARGLAENELIEVNLSKEANNG